MRGYSAAKHTPRRGWTLSKDVAVGNLRLKCNWKICARDTGRTCNNAKALAKEFFNPENIFQFLESTVKVRLTLQIRLCSPCSSQI